jgi:hypothetical protein
LSGGTPFEFVELFVPDGSTGAGGALATLAAATVVV